MTDFSFVADSIRESVMRMEEVIYAASAPHVRMRPTVAPDGNKWCCLYGDDLMSGVAGFGDTPQQACWDFDRAWQNELTPAASAIEARRAETSGSVEDESAVGAAETPKPGSAHAAGGDGK